MSCGVGCRCGSEPALLWLWCRLAATAPIGPLAWKPPYAVGVAQEMAKKGKKKKKEEEEKEEEGLAFLLLLGAGAAPPTCHRAARPQPFVRPRLL